MIVQELLTMSCRNDVQAQVKTARSSASSVPQGSLLPSPKQSKNYESLTSSSFGMDSPDKNVLKSVKACFGL